MEYSKTVVERLFDRAMNYRKELLLSATLVVVSGASITGYFFYKDFVSKQGHKAYAGAMQLLQARVLKENEAKGPFELAFTSKKEKWQAVAEAFSKVYAQYSHVGIGAMAGAAQAQALLHLGDEAQARTVLADVLTHINEPNILALYTLTYARLLIDSPVEGDKERGMSLLTQLAATKENAVHDSALYYLGLEYWLSDDMASAANYWKQLIAQYDSADRKSSPWVSKVKEKLALIDGVSESF